jgi:hypothetical protein
MGRSPRARAEEAHLPIRRRRRRPPRGAAAPTATDGEVRGEELLLSVWLPTCRRSACGLRVSVKLRLPALLIFADPRAMASSGCTSTEQGKSTKSNRSASRLRALRARSSSACRARGEWIPMGVHGMVCPFTCRRGRTSLRGQCRTSRGCTPAMLSRRRLARKNDVRAPTMKELNQK